MTDDDGGFNLQDAIQNGTTKIREYTSFLGIQRERFVCPECETACRESVTYNEQTAAFDGGACPSWYCGGCDSHFVREVDESSHVMDLYGRG